MQAGGHVINATSTFVHPFFNPNSNKYDVAIIRTAQNALVSAPTVRVLDYIFEKDFIKDSSVIAVGWGKLGAHQSPNLQLVKGKMLIDSSENGAFFLDVNFGGVSDEQSYDTGSPLLVRFNQKWVQIGIATRSKTNNNEHGVFTSLFNKGIHTFINRIVKFI